MKKFFLIALILAVFDVATPVLATKKPKNDAIPVQSAAEPATSSPGATPTLGAETIEVFSPEAGTTAKINMDEYIIGVVAAEMPVEYEPEALKAQALAALTYARYVTENGKKSVSADSAVNQSFRTKAELQAQWGSQFDENYKKIRDAVAAIEGLTITYDGQPILAAYFALSAGKTENAAEVWGKAYPYLVSVASDGDRLSAEAETKSDFSPDTLYRKLNQTRATAPCQSAADYIGDVERTAAGTVSRIIIGGTAYTGAEVRAALGLASADFNVSYDGEAFVFTVFGYGHFVGMSQYGADYMARQGADFQEIIKHYYAGVEITRA